MIDLRDHVEIQELYARYNHYIDSDRFDEWVSLFTSDGVFASAGQCRGHEQLAAFVRDRAERQQDLTFRGAQHWNTNLVLERDGDVVRGSCYLVRFAVEKASGAKNVVTLGRYEDELIRTDGAWRFARRTVHTD
jgi:3-phenylpropionate/cinnamic acid dioxygenase small subunit